MDLVVILSQLKDLDIVREYYARSADIARSIKEKLRAPEPEERDIGEISGHLPTLLDM